ncbi:hypothetical protein QE152_g40952 [Popillia japonica]|uniref:ISXO2-like transposase domain-containing protein n=1 Tax=Popillia japonica TaxID=7064 RepID=A0AAW1HEW2_POPJA
MLREELVYHVDVRSHLCTDIWTGYRNMNRTFRGHSTVNHTTNFVEPAREQDLHWVPVGRFNEACLDRRVRGPPREDGQVPFRTHTQTIERCWRDLKQSLPICYCLFKQKHK